MCGPVEGRFLGRRASREGLVGVGVGEVLRDLRDGERRGGGGQSAEGGRSRTVAADPDVRDVPHRRRHGDSTGSDPPGLTRNKRDQGETEEDPAGESGTEVHRVLGAVRSGDGDGGGGLAVVALLGGSASLARRIGDGGEDLLCRQLITDAGTTGRLHLLWESVRVVVVDLDL